MKRMRLETAALVRYGVLEVDRKIRTSGLIVGAIAVVVGVFGGEWMDSYLFVGLGLLMLFGAMVMFIGTNPDAWSSRAVGIFWVFIAFAALLIPAGIARFFGDDQAPWVGRTVWRSAAIVGGFLFASGILRYVRSGGTAEPLIQGESRWSGFKRRLQDET